MKTLRPSARKKSPKKPGQHWLKSVALGNLDGLALLASCEHHEYGYNNSWPIAATSGDATCEDCTTGWSLCCPAGSHFEYYGGVDAHWYDPAVNSGDGFCDNCFGAWCICNVGHTILAGQINVGDEICFSVEHEGVWEDVHAWIWCGPAYAPWMSPPRNTYCAQTPYGYCPI